MNFFLAARCVLFMMFYVQALSTESFWIDRGNSIRSWTDQNNWSNGIPGQNTSAIFAVHDSLVIIIDLNVSVSSLHFFVNVSDKFSLPPVSITLIISRNVLLKAGSMFVGDMVNLVIRGDQFEIINFMSLSESSITSLNVSSISVGDKAGLQGDALLLDGILSVCTVSANIYSQVLCNGTISLLCGSLSLYARSSTLYGNMSVDEQGELILSQGVALYSLGRLDVSGVLTLQNQSDLVIHDSNPSKFSMHSSSSLRGGTGLVSFTRISQCSPCTPSVHVLSGTSVLDIQIIQGRVSASGIFRQYGLISSLCLSNAVNLLDLESGQLEMVGGRLSLCSIVIRGPAKGSTYEQKKDQKDMILGKNTELILQLNVTFERANFVIPGNLIVYGNVYFKGPLYAECQGQVSLIGGPGFFDNNNQSAIAISGIFLPGGGGSPPPTIVFYGIDLINEGTLSLQGVVVQLVWSSIIQRKSSSIIQTDSTTTLRCSVSRGNCINIFDGSLEGEATIFGQGQYITIFNNGSIKPGYSNGIGSITIAGNFFQTEFGRIDIGVDGSGQYSSIVLASSSFVKGIWGLLSLNWNPSDSFFLGQKIYPLSLFDGSPPPVASLIPFQVESNGYGIAAVENLVLAWMVKQSSPTLYMVYLQGCAMGYKQTSTKNCEKCTPGYYGDQRGLTYCKECVQGKYSQSYGSTFCSGCLPGYFAMMSGSSTCQACTAGKYSNTNDTVLCHYCPAGTFQPSPASTFCPSCPPGKISAATGSVLCLACAAGKYEVNNSRCDNCTRGTYSSQSASTCLYCQPGWVAPMDGSSSCVSCEPGSFSNGSHPGHMATHCVQCQIGKYASKTASTRCYFCPQNQIAPAPGLTTCSSCPTGQVKSTTMTEACVNVSTFDSWDNQSISSTFQNMLSITNISIADSNVTGSFFVSVANVEDRTTHTPFASQSAGFPFFVLYAGLAGLLVLLSLCTFLARNRCKTIGEVKAEKETDGSRPIQATKRDNHTGEGIPYEELKSQIVIVDDESITAEDCVLHETGQKDLFAERVILFQNPPYFDSEEPEAGKDSSRQSLDSPVTDTSADSYSEDKSEFGSEGEALESLVKATGSDVDEESNEPSLDQPSNADSNTVCSDDDVEQSQTFCSDADDLEQEHQLQGSDSSDEASDCMHDAYRRKSQDELGTQALSFKANRDFKEHEASADQSLESMKRFKYLIRGSVPRYALQARDSTGAAQTAEFSLASTNLNAKGVGRLL